MFNRKDEKQPEIAADTILGNFALSAQLPNGRSLQVSGYVFKGESLEQLNYRLDTMQEAIERQRHRCEVPVLEAAREQRLKALEDYRQHLAGLEEKKKQVGQSLSSQEKMAINNSTVTIKKMLEEIDKADKAIQEAKEKGGLAEPVQQARRAGARA